MENTNNTIIWEEKDSIEPKMKLENNLMSVPNDIINDTKIKSSKNGCEDTGKKKRWIKNCPKCGKEQSYSTNSHWHRSIKQNRICLDCVHEYNKIKINFIGSKFGTLTITNQYYVNGKGILMVDYICDCGFKKYNQSFSGVRRRKMCILCKKQNKFKILPNSNTSFNLLYSSYIKGAKRRSLEFKLSKEIFREFTKQNCFYCGSPPNTTMRPNSAGGGYIYNGIDRKDSNIGYIIENCVSCCKTCNYAKLKMTDDDFINHVKKIYEYQLTKNH